MGFLQNIDESHIICYRNLSQAYEAEFSPLTGKLPNHLGLYEITELDSSHLGYLYFRDRETPLGFVVVNTGLERFDISEFYVIPNQRRQNIGYDMATAIFDRYPGAWQVRQIQGADRAYKFWLAVIDRYTQGTFDNSEADDAEYGRVRIQTFNSGT